MLITQKWFYFKLVLNELLQMTGCQCSVWCSVCTVCVNHLIQHWIAGPTYSRVSESVASWPPGGEAHNILWGTILVNLTRNATITSLWGIKAIIWSTNASCEAQIPPCEAQLPSKDASVLPLEAYMFKNTWLSTILIYGLPRHILPKNVDGEARTQLMTPCSP